MKQKNVVAIVFNLLIVTLTIIAMILAIFDVQKMGKTYVDVFKYYTTLSNLFLFITAILTVTFKFREIFLKNKPMPKWISILKLCATAATTVTMVTVICVLTPGAILKPTDEFDVAFLYSGSNCIFHVVSPIIAILSFILFETNRNNNTSCNSFEINRNKIYYIFSC